MKERIKKLQASLQEESLGAYLVTDSYNLRYMTGFTGTSGLALVTTKNAYFITDFRYTEQAKLQCQGYEVIEAGGSASHSSPCVWSKNYSKKMGLVNSVMKNNMWQSRNLTTLKMF